MQSSSETRKMYTAIVVTCSDQASANAYSEELRLRQMKRLIHPDTVVLCVVDPMPNIGSGGATLNAIYNITEHISALKGCTVISGDVLQNQHILVLHMGTTTPYSACSPGFLPVPATFETRYGAGFQSSGLATHFDVLLQMTMNVLANGCPPGFWVCCCDRVVSIPAESTVDWSTPASVRLFTVPMELGAAANHHGVVRMGENNCVEDIIYKGSEADLDVCRRGGSTTVPVVSGIAFFETQVVDTLLNMCVVSPLDNYTYLALDDGCRPISVRALASDKANMYRDDNDAFILSFFFDVLLSAASRVEREDFITGHRSGIYGTDVHPMLDAGKSNLRKQIRQVFWDSLHGKVTMKAEFIKDGMFSYMSHDPSVIHQLTLQCPYSSQSMKRSSSVSVQFSRHCSPLSLSCEKDDTRKNVLVNSLIGDGVFTGDKNVVFHSDIESGYLIGSNSMVINIESKDLLPGVQLPDDVVLESLPLKMPNELSASVNRVLIMFGINDKLKQDMSSDGSTIFNKSWNDFFARTTILPAELWSPEVPVSKRSLLTARLFPIYHPKGQVMTIDHLLWLQGSHSDPLMSNFWRSAWKLSLAEILDLCDPGLELSRRREMFFNIGKKQICKALSEKLDINFLPFFHSCITDGYFEQILSVLDDVAKSSTDPAVISRTFACIADVLGVKAGSVGGLRSGPAANLHWKPGLTLVEENRIAEAVDYMAAQRSNWFVTPDLLVRAARHYEGAFQIQVRKSVGSARQFIQLKQVGHVPMYTWVRTSCPARADISGTWSDTPPICYEQGGRVVALALSIDGKKPIGCRVKRIPEPKIILLMGHDESTRIECENFDDLLNFAQPNVPGALLKAAFFCTELLPLNVESTTTLPAYLIQTHGGGFLLHTWSDLPHGSGMGTSSILAGAIISALWTAVGSRHHVDSVIHAVLDLEQMLTTGGGWQDQVGGLYPGVKVGSSAKGLPLCVTTTEVCLPAGFQSVLEKHLLVVFTGKTRLARNMLQDVLRNWNARSPDIVNTAKRLITNAEECIARLKEGDLEGVGKCLNDCWSYKKVMAHGCEPNAVRAMMAAFEEHVHGQCLVGAGGGGFMIVITKQENSSRTLYAELERLGMADKASLHNVSIDGEGLKVQVDDKPHENVD